MVRIAIILLNETEKQRISRLACTGRETSRREQEGKKIERELVKPTTYPVPDRLDSSPPSSYTPPPYALPLALWSLRRSLLEGFLTAPSSYETGWNGRFVREMYEG
jgi:hypothetical protein